MSTDPSNRFMPEGWPVPSLDHFNREYFTAGRLVVQECATCGTVQHPPEEICHSCHGMELGFRETAGTGTIHSFVVVHHAFAPQLADKVPYAVVLVALDDHPHVRILGNVLDRDPDELAIGQPVSVTFETVVDEGTGESLHLPQWLATG